MYVNTEKEKAQMGFIDKDFFRLFFLISLAKKDKEMKKIETQLNILFVTIILLSIYIVISYEALIQVNLFKNLIAFLLPIHVLIMLILITLGLNKANQSLKETNNTETTKDQDISKTAN